MPASRTPPSAAVVVLAGGSGTRVGAGANKVLLPLAGKSVLTRSIAVAAAGWQFAAVLAVVRPQDEPACRRLVEREVDAVDVEFVHGGATRHASEAAALAALAGRISAGSIDVVVVHDGARPLASPGLFATVVRSAAQHGGVVPVLPESQLVRIDSGGELLMPVSERVGRAQTPQAFRAPLLSAAFAHAADLGVEGTDTASTVERYLEDHPQHANAVVAVPGAAENIKITYPDDLFLAERYLAVHHYRVE